MSLASTLFAAAMIAVSFMCLKHRDFYGIGLAMIGSLLLYVQPVRELIPMGQTAHYVIAIDLVAALIIIFFSGRTVTGRLMLATISAALILGHVPLLLGFTSIRTFDITANWIGWVQIVIIFGGTNGDYFRRLIGRYSDRHRDLSLVAERYAFPAQTLRARLFSDRVYHKKNIS